MLASDWIILSSGWVPAALGPLEPRHHRRVRHHGAADEAREPGLGAVQLREEDGDPDHGLQDPLHLQRVPAGGGAPVRLLGQDGD